MSSERTQLLLGLKDAAKRIAPYLHNGKELNDIAAEELCTSLLKCLVHGTRTREFYNTIPLWGLVEQLGALEPSKSSNVNLRASVATIAGFASLRTPLAKARGWIRLVLTNKILDEVLQEALAQPRLLSLFYHRESILCRADDVVPVVNLKNQHGHLEAIGGTLYASVVAKYLELHRYTHTHVFV